MEAQVIDPALARRVRVVGLDVDGVLTDGAVYLGMAGETPVELKRFDIQDGVGIRLLQDAGLEVVIISGRSSPATTLRARELGIEVVVQDDAARKWPALQALLAARGIALEEVAFLGDDLPDIPILERVGLPVAVRNAVPAVRALSRYVTKAEGGKGAVREFAQALLEARGAWQMTVHRYLAVRTPDQPEANNAVP